MSAGLDPQDRQLFARLADILIPEAEGMPAASAVGIERELLDRVLNYRPDLRVTLMELLRDARGRDPVETLARLAETDPAGFRALGLIAAGGYYISPVVRDLIGYPGQVRAGYDPDAIPDYVANGMLDRVVGRGSLWRRVD
jgi:hypothetical protein